jgi:hypothetical protein
MVVRIWRLDTTTPSVPPGGDFLYRPVPSEIRMINVRGGHTALVFRDSDAGVGGVPPDRLRFWDLENGRLLDRLEPARFAGVVRSTEGWGRYLDVAFDGTHLVYASENGLVRWWDVATGRPARPDWRPHRARSDAALAGDGRSLAVRCDDNRVRYFDLATGRECGPTLTLRGELVSISPHGSFLLARRGGELAVWQVPVTTRPPHSNTIEARKPFYESAAAPPDCEEYALGAAQPDGSATGRDTVGSRTLILRREGGLAGHRFATADGRPLGAPFHPLDDLPCYSRDGRLFAACRTQAEDDGQFQQMAVAAWDRSDGRQVLPWTFVKEPIQSLAFSPDGRTLAVGVGAGFWPVDVASRRPPWFVGQPGPIIRLEFSPDGRRIAAGLSSGGSSPPGVRLWNVASGRSVRTSPPASSRPSGSRPAAMRC